MAAKKPRKESNEEQQFEAWLIEAQAHGLVERYGKQPKFELIQGERVGGKFLHREHNYTGDFKVWLTALGEEVLRGVFQKSDILGFPNGLLYVDTKGSFQSHGGGRAFSINQKLVREKHNVWVAKVVPWIPAKKVTAKRKVSVPAKGLFIDTWCPAACRWAKPQKKPAIGISEAGGKACRTVEEFMLFVSNPMNEKED
jgi:hypothetical protein